MDACQKPDFHFVTAQKEGTQDLNRREFISITTQAAAFLTLGLMTGARATTVESSPLSAEAQLSRLLIGNFLRSAPCGIAWIVDDCAAFILDTGGPYVAGTSAPDGSYHAYRFTYSDANILFEWGRVGDSVVGRLSSDKPVSLGLSLSSGWPGWASRFMEFRMEPKAWHEQLPVRSNGYCELLPRRNPRPARPLPSPFCRMLPCALPPA